MVAVKTRLPSSQMVLLALLFGTLLLGRVIDLHWHQHLRSVSAEAQGPVTYIADASTLHSADHGDTDISLSGDVGSLLALPIWSAAALLLLLLLPLPVLLGVPVRLPPAEMQSPSRRRRRSQLPPPLRAPPTLC